VRSRICQRWPRKKKENQANWVKLDPEVKCYLPGVHALRISLTRFKLSSLRHHPDFL